MRNIKVIQLAAIMTAAEQTGNVCKYCLEPIPMGYYCCRRCFELFEGDDNA